ncbi:uncharacterized protein APUU_50501A [Aspergillus puulaauensis]|uniref:Uncharacterized protein n=1 Tax=Aspergillus puulaauensis TaxID=1220207 RepID=A0A7R7XQI9_9EURO|nr:uncharacterized protein APUU_50501A [Aspergillus puulaauensis]BCS25790.1 hypothetical protein APUU_50501A [Aspergillus puulaauensis]
MTNRRLLIFQETPLQSPTNPLTPTPTAHGIQYQQGHAQFQYIPVNKLGLPVHGPGSLPEGLGVGSLLNLPLRVITAFTEIFNGVKYKGWAIVAAGPYNDPTLGVGSPGGVGGTGKFYAVVLEQVSSPEASGSGNIGGA